jgi:hypothetical protein
VFEDHLGYRAALRLPLSENEILVDRRIDPWFFQRWIYVPLLKASLWQHGMSLIHGAGAEIDGNHVVVSGWAGAGKSRMILRLIADGARFFGDDWVALAEDGTVHAVSAQMNLNSGHRQYLDADRWPGRDPKLLPRLQKAAKVAARAATKYPKASMGFARIADAATAAGKIKVSLADVFPEAQVADAGPLKALFFVPRSGTFQPEPAQLPEMIAATSRSELLYTDDLESVLRYTFPGTLDGSLFGSVVEETTLITSGLFAAHKEILRPAYSPAEVERTASHIAARVSELTDKTAVA